MYLNLNSLTELPARRVWPKLDEYPGALPQLSERLPTRQLAEVHVAYIVHVLLCVELVHEFHGGSKPWRASVYRQLDGHVYELSVDPSSNQWSALDLSVATGAPSAAGDPMGYH